MRMLGRLEKNKGFWFMLFISLIFFLLRFPSLFEPYWYGDEGIYQAIGIALNNGLLLYQDIFDNKPPLLYILYSIFNSDQFLIRLVSLIFGILSCIFFFAISRKLFKGTSHRNGMIPYLTTSFFAIFFGLPLIEGNIANAENFMLLFILISSFLIVHIHDKVNSQYSNIKLLAGGLLLSIAFLFKAVAIFDFAAFLIFLTITLEDKRIKKLLLFAIGFASPILFVSLFFLINGAFLDFLKATFSTNISYVNYANKLGNLPIFLFIKLLILILFLGIVFFKRKNFSPAFSFILIWFSFSLFNTFFSQRAYTHYVLVLLPSFALALGLIFFDKKYQKIIATIFLIVLVLVLSKFHLFNFKKTINYYYNFFSYVIGAKGNTSYQAFFDRNTPRDYKIASYIRRKLRKNDTIFVWGNNAQLYKLTDTVPQTKYVVTYHITGYKDGIERTKLELEKSKPKFIIVMPNVPSIPFALSYTEVITIQNVMIYERQI